MDRAAKLYSLGYGESRTYLFSALFVLGNILLPQLAHLAPNGGITWLPIYLFTLIGAYKFGWRVGLITALFSPIVNHLLFGMPAAGMLPVILVKSSLLAISAGYFATRFGRVTLVALALTILSYQLVGTLVEWAIVGDLFIALQDLRVGLPGIATQLFGGYLILKHIK